MRQVVEAVDGARADAGLSKTALAHAIGANPSVVRRLLTDEGSNPTIKTLLEVSEAVGLRIRFERISDGQPVAVVPDPDRESQPVWAHAAG
jgi:ribosome-binding protein aMBF1 (putative translation factor)